MRTPTLLGIGRTILVLLGTEHLDWGEVTESLRNLDQLREVTWKGLV